MYSYLIVWGLYHLLVVAMKYIISAYIQTVTKGEVFDDYDSANLVRKQLSEQHPNTLYLVSEVDENEGDEQ